MLSRSLSRSYAVPAPADQVWAYLTDPEAVAASSSHPVRIAKPAPGFGAGTWWDEQHGEECDFDVVRWTVVAADPRRSFTMESRQSGARQQITNAVAATAGGTQVRTTLRLRPALRGPGGPIERLLILLVLLTGRGMSVVAAQLDQSITDDLTHFTG